MMESYRGPARVPLDILTWTASTSMDHCHAVRPYRSDNRCVGSNARLCSDASLADACRSTMNDSTSREVGP
jgi:hypothetical protein